MSLPVHSPIGASSMYRWSVCPGSVRLSQGIPSVSSKYAEEGTLAHELAAYILREKKVPSYWTDAEMLEAVMVYVNAVEREFTEVVEIFVEHRFDLTQVYPGLYGTADCVLFHPERKLLQVFDYKHGAGIAVEVESNPQLMYYGLGALLSTGFICEKVELVIVQPRCPHPDGTIRKWVFPAIDLLEFWADLSEYAKATEKKDAPLKAGDHCRFCPAAGICPVLHEQALAAAQAEFRPALSYDPKKLAETLNLLEMVEAWAKQVREFAYQEAEHGRIPPGWKLVPKRATRKWALPEEDIASELVKLGFGQDLLYERKLKSPAQMEKLLDSPGKKLLSTFMKSESSGNTLAPEHDRRPAVNTDISGVFTKIEALTG